MDQRLIFGLGVSALFGFGRWLLPAVPKPIAASGVAAGIGLVLWAVMPFIRPGPASLAIVCLAGLTFAGIWQFGKGQAIIMPPVATSPATAPSPNPSEPSTVASVPTYKHDQVEAPHPVAVTIASSPPTSIDQSVKSFNQSGGITAHTINLAPPPRNLDDAARSKFLQMIPRDLTVMVISTIGDAETYAYAKQIWDFLAQSGYKMSEGGQLQSFGVPPIQPGIVGIDITSRPGIAYISVGSRI